MVSRCSVRGCKSGQPDDKKEKIRAGIKPATLFTVPKVQLLLEQWSKALNQEFSHKDRVCELHFADADVKRADHTLLPDGSIFSLPMSKYTLKKDAIPIDFPDQENKAPKSLTSKENTARIRNLCYVENVKKPKVVPETLEETSSHESKSKNEPTENNPDETKINNTSTDSDQALQQESPTIEIDEMAVQNHIRNSFLNDHHYYMDQEKLCPNHLEDEKFTKSQNAQEKCQMEQEGKFPHSSVIKLGNVKEDENFIYKMIDYLRRTPLPRMWSWMQFTRVDSGITFTQIDCKTRKIRCFVELHVDSSITIQTGDEKVRVETEMVLSSVENIIKTLTTVEKFKICGGTGVERDGYTRDPKCVIDLETRLKMQSTFYRCIHCRKMRRTCLQRGCPTKSDLKMKYVEAKKEVDLLKRKCKYYKETLVTKNKKLKAITDMIKSVNRYNKAINYIDTSP